MMGRRVPASSSGAFRIAVVVLAGVAAMAVVGVLALRLARAFPGGEALRYPWEAMRAFLFRAQNPYHVLALLYGQARQEGVAFSPQVYPLAVALVWFAPLALVRDFVAARAIALVGGGMGLLLALRWLARSVGWQPQGWEKALLVVLALGGYFSALALWRAQVSVMVTVMVALSLATLAEGRDSTAGVLLALTWVRPELALGVSVLALAWTASRRRWRLWGSFWGATGALWALSLWLLPTWPMDALRLWAGFPAEHSPWLALAAGVPGIGRQVAWLFRLLIVFIVGEEWVMVWGKLPSQAVWALALTAWSALLVGSRVTASDQVLLTIPLVVVMAYWVTHWQRYGRRAAMGLGFLWLLPWVAWGRSLLLARVPSLAEFFVMPLLVGVLLYTVRWWATRPQPILPLLSEE